MLEVASVDWHMLENAKEHHTDKYEVIHEESTPVLRRAQPFKLSITFKNRPFNEDNDRVRLFFFYNKIKLTPRLQSAVEHTTVTKSNKLTNSKDQWSLQLQSQEKNTITLLVRSPPIASFGRWHLTIKSGFKTRPQLNVWKDSKAFYMLFNPWVKEDDVFMPETRLLDEYVLNDIGKLYTSSAKKPIGMNWIFGQFASAIIKVVADLAANMDKDEYALGNPVELSRGFSESIGNILEGNWTGKFDGGTPPWLWSGSIPIYEDYLKNEEPVKYAQCFIYSGVLATAFRAIGIPARSVTNFVSAMGSDVTMTVDFIYDEKGDNIADESGATWNFHVWVDAWMARYDLPDGYGGWQALDGTSGNGPCSCEAVKRGEICYNYDVQERLSGVNADRARWTKDENGEYHLVKVDKTFVGRAILTKRPFIYDPHGDTDFDDIIDCYKEQEGSKEERLAMYNAVKLCKAIVREYDLEVEVPFHVEMPDEDDVAVKFEIEEIESIIMGEPINIKLSIENNDEEEHEIEACLSASAVYYNGSKAGFIKRASRTIRIKDGTSEHIILQVYPVEYASKLVDFCSIKINCIARIKENNFTWADESQLTIEMPEIAIKEKKDLMRNKEGILLFQFKNPLSSKLTKCSITFEAPGVGRNVKLVCKDIKPDEDVMIEHKVKPTDSGEIPIKAIFTSKELNFLSGSSVITVD